MLNNLGGLLRLFSPPPPPPPLLAEPDNGLTDYAQLVLLQVTSAVPVRWRVWRVLPLAASDEVIRLLCVLQIPFWALWYTAGCTSIAYVARLFPRRFVHIKTNMRVALQVRYLERRW